jgi:hypothetical protein
VSSAGNVARAVPVDDVYTIGVAFYLINSFGNPHYLVQFQDSTGVQHVTIYVTTAGEIEVRRGSASGTVLGATSGLGLVIERWYFFEAKVFIDDSTGYVTVRIDEAQVLNLTGQDTRNAGIAEVGKIAIGNVSSSSIGTYFDDLYICDNTGSAPYDSFLGDNYVDTVLPDADGDVNDWAANTGNRYQAVDDPADMDDETTYVYESVNESKQLFSLGSLSTALGSILAAQLLTCGRKDSSPPVNVRPLFRTSGDVDYEGGLKSLADNYTAQIQMWELNPDDSQAWEPTDIDNGQFGMIFTYTTTTTA